MKKVFNMHAFALIFAVLTAISGCKKDDAEIPALNTVPASVISATTAETGGIITSDGGSEVIARGVFWGTGEIHYPETYGTKTIDGKGSGKFSTNITGLTSNTTYYVMAYATNNAGTAYGELLRFTTPVNSEILFNPEINYGLVSDIDGNSYKTVQIGEQKWMAENLRTTIYNDGTPIRNVTDDEEWMNLNASGLPDTEQAAYCWYNNDAFSFQANYGALYTWYAAQSDKLCPSGWHVPSPDEWGILIEHLGGRDFGGGKLKEAGTSHWLAPNTEATNETGFTAMPGGSRYFNPDLQTTFFGINTTGGWWSSGQHMEPMEWEDGEYPAAFRLSLGYDGSSLYFVSEADFTIGLSVRCISNGN